MQGPSDLPATTAIQAAQCQVRSVYTAVGRDYRQHPLLQQHGDLTIPVMGQPLGGAAATSHSKQQQGSGNPCKSKDLEPPLKRILSAVSPAAVRTVRTGSAPVNHRFYGSGG